MPVGKKGRVGIFICGEVRVGEQEGGWAFVKMGKEIRGEMRGEGRGRWEMGWEKDCRGVVPWNGGSWEGGTLASWVEAGDTDVVGEYSIAESGV